MTVPRPVCALVKAILVVVAAGAGAGAGSALGGVYVDLLMPNAGLDALGPLLFGTLAGSVLGVFATLAAMFKVPRLQREYAAWFIAVALGLVLLWLLGYIGSEPLHQPTWTVAALGGPPVALLIGVVVSASLLFAPPPPADAEAGARLCCALPPTATAGDGCPAAACATPRTRASRRS